MTENVWLCAVGKIELVEGAKAGTDEEKMHRPEQSISERDDQEKEGAPINLGGKKGKTLCNNGRQGEVT